MIDQQSLNKMEDNITIPQNEDTTAVNLLLGQFLAVSLSLHLLRIKNRTADELVAIEGRPYGDMILNLNCDPQIADKDFLAKVQESDNRTQEAFESCKPRSDDQRKSLVHRIAKMELADVLFFPLHVAGLNNVDSMIAQREDFDLKASALRTWAL